MKPARLMPLALFLLLLTSGINPLQAQTLGQKAAPIANWPCEYCFKEAFVESKLTLDLARISGDSYRFSHYTALERELHAFAGLELFSVEKDAAYLNATLENAGLDALFFRGNYGRWGEYRLRVKHREIPLRRQQDLVTPFTLTASPPHPQLALPGNWDLSQKTDTTSWRKFKLGTDWHRSQLDWQSQLGKWLSYRLDYQRIKQQGNKESAAAWLTGSSYLPLPVEQHIDLLSGSLSYRGNAWHSSLHYRLSRFDNQLTSVTFANPYPLLAPGADTGQLALASDNKAYKLALKANYNFSPDTWLKTHAATGEHSQDNRLLPYSSNPLLNRAPGQTAFKGKLTTRDLSVKLGSRLTSKVSVDARYRYRQRDNRSTRLQLTPVVTDTFTGNAARNFPRDRQRRNLTLGAQWRFAPGQLASLKFSHNSLKRNFSNITDSTTDRLTAKLTLNSHKGWQILLGAGFSERDGEQQKRYPEYLSYYLVGQTPGLVPYHQANKQQSNIKTEIRSPARHKLTAGLSGQYRRIRYDSNTFGLQKNRLLDLALDLHYPLNGHDSIHAYLRREKLAADLAVSQGSPGLHWLARNRDHVMQLGVNFSYTRLLDGKLDFSFDGQYSNGNSYTRLASGDNAPALDDLGLSQLPKLDSDNIRLALSWSYRYSPKASIFLLYRFEKQLSDDYALDKIAPGSVPDLLTFGAGSYNYHVDYFGLRLNYRLF